MPKKRQVVDNNEKLNSFIVRIPDRLKRRLVNCSDRTGQSQASIIAGLIEEHIPEHGIVAPKVSFTEHDNPDNSDNQVDLENWLAQHGKG
jgi:hypothetical protein